MLKIRFKQQGSKNRKRYRLIATDSKRPRDGKYLDCLGWYDPQSAEEKNAELNETRLCELIGKGAQVSPKAKSLIKRYAPAAYKMI